MNFRELLKSKHTRKIGVFFVLGILLWSIPQAIFAHVYGAEGLAPTLSSNVPGIERPFPQDEEKFTFAIIGDKTGGGEENWPIFDQAMNEINRLHPDFAIMVGDLIQGFDTWVRYASGYSTDATQPKGYITDLKAIDEQWNQFYEHANRIQVPLFFLPGNHDISNQAMYDYWKANIGKTYYSFDYKGCHFILLNTEEGKWADEVQFGSEQMEWLCADIPAHRQKKHIFIFMHQPAWYYSGEELAQWETVESWLEGLPYTVFAGHFHNLTYETRKGHRYFVLSTTGGSLWPSEVLELGAFHHYTLVTVDGQDVHTVIIQPGNAPPYGIAQREFGDKAHQLFSWEKDFPLVQGLNEGKLIVHLNNTFEKTVSMKLKYAPSNGSSWDFAPREVTYVIQPGKKEEIVLKASYDFENICMCSRDVAQVEHAAGLFKKSEQVGSMFYSFCPSTDKCVTSSGQLQISKIFSPYRRLHTIYLTETPGYGRVRRRLCRENIY